MFSETLEHLSADESKIRRDWITKIMLVSEQWPVDACIMLEQLLKTCRMVMQMHYNLHCGMLDRAKARDFGLA